MIYKNNKNIVLVCGYMVDLSTTARYIYIYCVSLFITSHNGIVGNASEYILTVINIDLNSLFYSSTVTAIVIWYVGMYEGDI